VPLVRAVGYDIAPIPEGTRMRYPELEFRQVDFVEQEELFDLVALNDVIEHVTAPHKFLELVGQRARYVALHVPLDDREPVEW